jgi:iron complex outermembrane receptor protein
VVVSGARLGPLVDRRLPGHPEVLDLSHRTPGAAAAAELVHALPGVSLTNDQGSRAQPTLELRGFTLSPVVGVSQGVSVFLDGVRVNEPDAQEVNFDLLPMEAIEHADLVPGASAIFGKNSLAGSLVLRTARGDTVPVVRAGLAIGPFGERDGHLLASGLRAGIDGLVMVAATTDDGYQAQSGASTRQLFATVGHRTVTGDLAFSLLMARDRLLEAGSLPERWLPAGRRANYTGGDFFHPELLQASVRGERVLGRLALRGNVFGRRNRIEQLNVNASDADTHAFVDNRSAGVTGELTADSRLGGRPLTLSVGAELSRSTIEYRVLAEPHADAPAPPPDCATAGAGMSALCEDARSAGDDAGLYVQAMLQATDRLSVVASLRGDRARVPFEDRLDPANDGANGFQRLSPRVGVVWMTDAVRLYASVGSAFRAPAPLELACASAEATCPLPFSLGADPPLAPVVAWNYEVGGSWSAPSSSTLALSLFHTDVRDEILFVSAQRAAGYFRNVDRTRRDGLEGSLRLPLPGEGLRLVGSYAFVAATFRSSATLASALAGNDVRAGDGFAQSPRHRAAIGLGMARVTGDALVDAELSARAVSSSWFRGDEANRMPTLPGMVVGDLRLAVRRPGAAVTLRVDNLLDRRYALYGVYAENSKGEYGTVAPAGPAVERFVTPAYPRTIVLALEIQR